jgi:hypothetical protein
MTDDLVTVATFPSLPEAEAGKLRLEAEGLTVFLADAEIVSMDWLLGNAIGYIKLQVPRSQAEQAAALLEQMRDERQQRDEEENEAAGDVCLACGAALPEDAAQCPVCGWSYTESESEEA